MYSRTNNNCQRKVAHCSTVLLFSTVTEGWRVEAAVTSARPGPVPCVVSPILTDPPLAQSAPGLLNTLTKQRRWLPTPALTSGSANAGASLEQEWRSSTQVIVLELWTGPGLPIQLWKGCSDVSSTWCYTSSGKSIERVLQNSSLRLDTFWSLWLRQCLCPRLKNWFFLSFWKLVIISQGVCSLYKLFCIRSLINHWS